jgi:hypothetical protein
VLPSLGLDLVPDLGWRLLPGLEPYPQQQVLPRLEQTPGVQVQELLLGLQQDFGRQNPWQKQKGLWGETLAFQQQPQQGRWPGSQGWEQQAGLPQGL